MIPEAFARRISEQLGDAADAYFASLEQSPLRGLRRNPHKMCNLSDWIGGIGAPVPWAPDGFYLDITSTAGAHPLHEAGAYYLQEPSAMLPATLLAVRPGETVLDLCAAPGGKSTQLAAAMAGEGTLVCNEFVPGRAQILSRNLERMGVQNAVVVSADPARLAQAWPALFDAILVDAPCSGEGMFRRHPETQSEWDADAPTRCALRQSRILESACAMLKPGGRLCYSTCTLSREENDDVVLALLQAHPELEAVDFSVPIGNGKNLVSRNGGLHLYPHEVLGEGHFVALFRKMGVSPDIFANARTLLPAAQALCAPDPAAANSCRSFCEEVFTGGTPLPNAMLGDTLIAAPDLPPLRGIRVLRAGLSLGQFGGKVFKPDHALAMAAPPYAISSVALTLPQAAAYQRGETLPAAEGARGYAVVTLAGLPLGFVKASDGMLKNHYPKGLRRQGRAFDDEGDTNGNDHT